ncbi:deoxynucleoside kinase, partial [Staphylococcus capitis]|uniref:deoxynucleoside kinase n=1 Tax=Staphylococcus capitis TaxID=29388 RepID=UPI00164262BF
MNKPFIPIQPPIPVPKSSLPPILTQTLPYYQHKQILHENPFLSHFYHHIQNSTFQTQIFFLSNTYKQIQHIHALEQRVLTDYHIHKNKIFA